MASTTVRLLVDVAELVRCTTNNTSYLLSRMENIVEGVMPRTSTLADVKAFLGLPPGRFYASYLATDFTLDDDDDSDNPPEFENMDGYEWDGIDGLYDIYSLEEPFDDTASLSLQELSAYQQTVFLLYVPHTEDTATSV